MLRITFVAGFLLLLVVFTGCGTSELDAVLKEGIERDVIAKLPLEITELSVKWTDKSAADASGQFTVKMKTTEALYESIANEDALQQLDITDTYEREFNEAERKYMTLPLIVRSDLDNARPKNLSLFRYYDVLVPKGEVVTLTGTVELTKSSGNDWQVVRFLVNPFSCGDTFTSEPNLGENEYRLDDSKTKEAVGVIIRERRDFAAKVDAAVAEQERNRLAVANEQRQREADEQRRRLENERRQREEEVQRQLEAAEQRRREAQNRIIDIRVQGFNSIEEFTQFANAQYRQGFIGAFLGAYSYSVGSLNLDGDSSSLIMRISTGFTSAESDEILFPGDMNVTGNVIDENERRFISLSVNGDADNIRKLRVSDNYQALVWFRNFHHNNGRYSAEVQKIEIIKAP